MSDLNMKNNYYTSIVMIEKLHRLFLDVIGYELNKLKIKDINNVQSLILYNIATKHLSVGDLTERGYYLGSNVSYNLRKMVDTGYVLQCPCTHDRRSSEVSLTEKGLEIYELLENLFSKHSEKLNDNNVSDEMINNLIITLSGLEKYLNKKD